MLLSEGGMLGAELTIELLSTMALDTRHPAVDAVVESTVRLCLPEIRELMLLRDRALGAHGGQDKLSAQGLELLSETAVDLDSKLMARV